MSHSNEPPAGQSAVAGCPTIRRADPELREASSGQPVVPVDPGDDLGDVAGAVRGGDLETDQLRAWRDALESRGAPVEVTTGSLPGCSYRYLTGALLGFPWWAVSEQRREVRIRQR
jgi:hypothetical protein